MITITMKSDISYEAGSRIELTSGEGALTFLLGQYEITQVIGRTFTARVVTQNTPASKEMNVRVVPATPVPSYGRNAASKEASEGAETAGGGKTLAR